MSLFLGLVHDVGRIRPGSRDQGLVPPLVQTPWDQGSGSGSRVWFPPGSRVWFPPWVRRCKTRSPQCPSMYPSALRVYSKVEPSLI